MKREPFDLQKALFEKEPVCTVSGIAVNVVAVDFGNGTVQGHFDPEEKDSHRQRYWWDLEGKYAKRPEFDLRMGVASTTRCKECGRWTPIAWGFASDVVR